jgi:hypothetical protein
MDSLVPTDEAIEVLAEPLTITMAGWRVEPVRIDLRNGQVAKTASRLCACGFEHGPEARGRIDFLTGGADI